MTTSTSTPPSIAFGFFGFGKTAKISTLPEAQKFLDVLKSHRVQHIDTSRMYDNGGSEEFLGQLGAGKDFKIATKVFPALNSMPSLGAGFSNNAYTHSAKDIHKALDASLKALQQEKVDIYYLHAPDRKTPFEETLAAIDKEYKAGRFDRFGISNFTAEDVEKIIELCQTNGWIKPSVYQGMYNGINRSSEKKLMPVLRKNKISFIAYSPLAGGFFTMKEEGEEVGEGKRFDPKNGAVSDIYRGLYWNETYFKALRTLRPLAEKNNVGMIELAVRWCVFHSALSGEHGDQLLLGSSSTDQLKANLTDIQKGPLPKELVSAMEDVWQTLRDDAFAMESNFA